MKKILLTLFLLFPIFASGAPINCNLLPNDTRKADQFLQACAVGTVGLDPGRSFNTKEGVRDTIKTIASSAIVFGALLAVGALVWAGIQYTTAYGEDEKIKKAKTTGIYALIGLILLMGSFGLVDIFINFIYNIAGA